MGEKKTFITFTFAKFYRRYSRRSATAVSSMVSFSFRLTYCADSKEEASVAVIVLRSFSFTQNSRGYASFDIGCILGKKYNVFFCSLFI